jgi:two-component system KDP operon response regulator KdpE
MRILLVDDEPEFLLAISKWLRAQGHRPFTASDARDVMKLVEIQDFDLICLDLMMPHINGIQLIPGIHQRRPGLPIVVMSGGSDTAIAVEAAKSGIEDYLTKPLDFSRLDAILKRLSPVS